jgi:hypothetical protein
MMELASEIFGKAGGDLGAGVGAKPPKYLKCGVGLSIKFVVEQYARPAVEYLHGIDAGLELPNQICRRSVHKNIEQLGK